MQKCDKCNAQFKWKPIYKSLCLAYKPIQCSQCGTRHRIATSSRVLVSLLTVPPLIIFGFYISSNFSLTSFYIAALMITLGVIISVFLPFLLRYDAD